MSLVQDVATAAWLLKAFYPEYREGQATVNALHRVAPDLAATLTADQPHDPFYDDGKAPAFWAWLVEQEKSWSP